ncbi:MAG: type IX secretion system membrane protein PorP/SprF [Ferruginibacter sp.]|nr:type IX secretion system membrane protein PorP/SprF [Ferruginibacter sp.]
MKKIVFVVIVYCFMGEAAFSQAKPFYTQYILNNYILNPGITGIENYTDVKLSYRNQWAGITGHPVTSYFTIHTPLGKKDLRTNATSFQVLGEHPGGPKAWDEYAVSPAHHGLGLQVINDKAGYINRWSAAVSYAYHQPLGVKTSLAAGLNAGVSSVSLDRSKIEWGNLDPNDPAIGYNNGQISKIKPEIGAGVWLYSARYFLGVSVLNIIPGKARFVKNSDYGETFTPNFFASGGYKFALSDNVTVLPSVMVQYWQPQLTSIHANVKMQYQDFFWLGASYRHADLVGGYSGMIGVNVSNTFNISYAYEHATSSRLQTFTKGTHEIVLGFLIGNKHGSICPRNIW